MINNWYKFSRRIFWFWYFLKGYIEYFVFKFVCEKKKLIELIKKIIKRDIKLNFLNIKYF